MSTSARSPRAGCAPCRAAARSRAVARSGRQFVGGTRDLADRGERLVALRAGELVFHLREGRPDDVVVVHVRTDRLDHVEPHAMNQIEVAGRERGRMRADVIGVVAAAVVVDDEPNVERVWLLGALPGFAEQPRLIVGGEQRRLADVQLRPRADDGGAIASKTFRPGTMSRCTGRRIRSASATTRDSSRRSASVGVDRRPSSPRPRRAAGPS